ncbi:Protein kinase domain-containing protein [Mycena indigotica]|uniref:Protein kinase domain-containing protein n=1 Tax=Mycena indigotica TaxID=2126181 RepID=A0A8H6T329_9AGAR|nr:Protein kinase domain-containing protein [Mycena indigotica]KAF7309356.1 Protein kinase domain-containing protein [Mycena indigotica]
MTCSEAPEISTMGELGTLLSWSPAQVHASTNPAIRAPPPILPPHHFYNKHLRRELILKRVLSLPFLVENLSQTATKLVDSITADELGEVPTTELSTHLQTRPRREIAGADTIADYYSISIGEVCTAIASKLLIPQSRDWGSSVCWARFTTADRTLAATGVEEHACLYVLTDKEDRNITLFPGHAELLGDRLSDWQRLAAFGPKLGTWIHLSLCPESERLLADLDHFPETSFPYKLCRTVHSSQTESTFTRPRDAASVPWSIPDKLLASASFIDSEQSNKNLRPRNQSRRSETTHNEKPRSVPSARRRPHTTAHLPSPLTAEGLVQLAWARATENNSSLIVFNCGNYERICVRHRETQTLFISPVFDVTACKDPGYIQLQVGTYTAMTLDAIARAKEAKRTPAPIRRSPRKRRNPDPTDSRAKKRQKMSIKTREKPLPPIAIASQRDMMFLTLQYGIHCSPAPASFIRAAQCLVHATKRKPNYKPPIKRSYKPEEYFELLLTSQIGDGATGVVHSANLRVVTKAGSALTHDNLVLKIAFQERQQVRMRHEYAIYQRLAEHGVTGVPQVYGLFEDLEGGAIALLMNNCGKTIWDLRPDKKRARTVITSVQRARFIEILTSVHRAGVRHCDIRAENLLIDTDGEAFIVDFDRGRFEPSEGKKKWEMEIMDVVTEGGHHDFSMPSPKFPDDDKEWWPRSPVPTPTEESDEDTPKPRRFWPATDTSNEDTDETDESNESAT